MITDLLISLSFLLIVFLGFKREFDSYSSALISTFLTLILPGLIITRVDESLPNDTANLGVWTILVSVGAYTSIRLFSPNNTK